ncbi:hypothetical protein ANN_08349 [Periplaneta americana]|uniref:Uncharacterized protein n=1 Tax=Periplaneta americana TaxID=6978 RepID=A0ABQ8T2Q7_PERAM|nr:hypothetical protein ANN_08349 [Periplaneta americana]
MHIAEFKITSSSRDTDEDVTSHRNGPSVEGNISREISHIKFPPNRKRKRHHQDWERFKHKRRKNKGQQYTSLFNKEVIQTRAIVILDSRKEKMYQTEIASREELVAKINTTAMKIQQHGLDNVQREVRRRAEVCIRAKGGHFEHLL